MDNNDVYIHLMNAQELGYRNGIPRGAGRYVYVSKHYSSFFPPLSDSIVNDYHLVNIVGDKHPNKTVLAKYVYHNDKIVEHSPKGRDEFRLYFNNEYDPDGNYFKPLDILVIRKITEEVIVENDLKEKTNVYRLFKIRPQDPRYKKLKIILGDSTHILDKSDNLQGMGFDIPKDIEMNKKIVTKDIKEFVLTTQSVITTPGQIKRVRNVAFRDLVLMFYKYECCISGSELLIEFNNISNLEAAHIIPFSQEGINNPINGIPLNRGLHWAFDNGFFTITPEYKVDVHPKVIESKYLSSINGKTIYIPEDSRARPSQDSLIWHKQNTYGKFLNQ